MNGKPFTVEEDDYLVYAHDARLSLTEMAYALDRPYGSICTRRAYLGLKYKDRIVGSEPGDPVETEEYTPWPEPERSLVDKICDYSLHIFTAMTGAILLLVIMGLV
jgi:hypothetical protein